MDLLGGGSPTAIAKSLGDPITRQVIEYWVVKGYVPADRAPMVEQRTASLGELIEVEALCPDRHWQRIKDKAWPHPKGRPLLDVAAEVG